MSLNEYVVDSAVASAVNDLANRRAFAADAKTWEELQGILDRPAIAEPRIASLRVESSVLDSA